MLIFFCFFIFPLLLQMLSEILRIFHNTPQLSHQSNFVVIYLPLCYQRLFCTTKSKSISNWLLCQSVIPLLPRTASDKLIEAFQFSQYIDCARSEWMELLIHLDLYHFPKRNITRILIWTLPLTAYQSSEAPFTIRHAQIRFIQRWI